MKTIDNVQVEKALEDIASIKKIINRNKPIFQQLLDFTHYRLVIMLAGISVIVYSMLFYFLMGYYGSYEAIPGKSIFFIYITIFIDLFFIAILEYRCYVNSLKIINQRLTLRSLVKDFCSNRYKHFLFTAIFLAILLVVFFSIKGIPYFIIPTFAILVGLECLAGAMLYLKHVLVMGYWYLITGIVLLIFNTIPAPVALTISFGVGYIILSVLGYIDHNLNKVE